MRERGRTQTQPLSLRLRQSTRSVGRAFRDAVLTYPQWRPVAEEFVLTKCPHCGSERAVYPEDPELLKCYNCDQSYSQDTKNETLQTSVPFEKSDNLHGYTLRRVTTTDDTLQVYREHDLDSDVIARLANGVEIQFGTAVQSEGRAWIEANIDGGNVGWVLASSARGHTTLDAVQIIQPKPNVDTFTQTADLSTPRPEVAVGGTWVCPTCNCIVQSPKRDSKKKPICINGHRLYPTPMIAFLPMGFQGIILISAMSGAFYLATFFLPLLSAQLDAVGLIFRVGAIGKALH